MGREQVVGIQTDGIVTKQPLPVSDSDELGEWKCDRVTNVLLANPGVYFFTTDSGREIVKRRGFAKALDRAKVERLLLDPNTDCSSTAKRFVKRFTAYNMKSLHGKRYQWVTQERHLAVDLHSKRDAPTPIVLPDLSYQPYPPRKVANGKRSTPYKLAFDDTSVSYLAEGDDKMGRRVIAV